MAADRGRNWIFRAGQAAGLLLMAVAALFDVDNDTFSRPLVGPALLVQLTGTVAVWFPAHRQGSRLAPALLAACAGVSLAVTVAQAHGVGGGALSLAATGGTMLALLVVARRGAVGFAALAMVVTGVALVVQPMQKVPGAEGMLIGMVELVAAMVPAGAGLYLRYLDSVRERQLQHTRVEQRAEFARDLHDFVAHHVTGIIVQAQGAKLIAERDPARAATALDQIERAGAEAMTAMRRMVGVLRDADDLAPLAPVRGVADLAELVDEFRACGGPPVRLRVDGDPALVPVHVSTSVYRVVMEALTNVRQHAPGATVVDVSVRLAGGGWW